MPFLSNNFEVGNSWRVGCAAVHTVQHFYQKLNLCTLLYETCLIILMNR